jgi:RimJ/RimL family protein N-acetyltransferase
VTVASAFGGSVRAMHLRPITMDDLPLYEAMLTDEREMSELGGPLERDGLQEKLRGIVAEVERGEIWYFAIVPDDLDEAVGTVCVWDHAWDDETISEIGWMVRPEFQGRGLGSAAVAETLRKARSEGRWKVIHAFPGETNGPSNAICRKNGFERLELMEYEYVGRAMRGYHWRIDLGRDPQANPG